MLVFSLAACGSSTGDEPLPTSPPDQSDPLPRSDGSSIAANGVLLPFRRVELSLGVAGFVESAPVEVGALVEAGQVLVALDDSDLDCAVALAELDLRQAELRLERLQQPPDEAEVHLAQRRVDQTAAALEAAQLNLGTALNSVLLNEALEDAGSAVRETQSWYQIRLDEYEQGEIDYWFVDQARQAYEEAELAHTRLQQQASVQVEGAQNAVTDAQNAYQEAQDALQRLVSGAEAHEVDTARLDVERAQLALEAAQTDLARAVLRAPFDSVVSVLHVSAGEWAAPGMAVVELLDISQWRIETRNIGELEIASIRVGQEVRVWVNAFRQEELTGRVMAISPVAVVQQGDTTYTLLIELDPTELDLRTGMTARVEVIVR
jgi:HlyD family secretion protein